MYEWDEIYKKKDYAYYDVMKPHESMNKIIDFFKENGVKRVLDLGCGTGRNSLPLLLKGFEVSGIDISTEGIKIFNDFLIKNDFKADLKVGDVFNTLPYEDDSFDAIISVQVLQHNTEKKIRFAINELKRVLKPKGFIFITLCGRISNGKVRYCLVKTAKKIAPNTYVPTIGGEAGLTHFIYNKKRILNHYKDFKILDSWKDNKDYYCFIAQLK